MANWTLDKAHSEINFKVRHMMISNVRGAFKNFDVTLETEGEDFHEVKSEAVIQTNSISTNNEERDKHLRSAEFFHTEKYPEITFKASGLRDEVTGDLTINGVTKPVTLNVEFGGISKDPWGNTKAGFSFTGKIKRGDFGLTWNAALETGGLMVSDDVQIAGELQFIKG